MALLSRGGNSGAGGGGDAKLLAQSREVAKRRRSPPGSGVKKVTEGGDASQMGGHGQRGLQTMYFGTRVIEGDAGERESQTNG